MTLIKSLPIHSIRHHLVTIDSQDKDKQPNTWVALYAMKVLFREELTNINHKKAACLLCQEVRIASNSPANATSELKDRIAAIRAMR